MWFNFWAGGFFVGLLLARAVQLPVVPWPLLLLGMVLLCVPAYRRWWLWLLCGFGYGSWHTAPLPRYPLAIVQSEQHNPLQFFYRDIIVSASPSHRWHVRGQPYSSGSVLAVSSWSRHFIFARPPHLQGKGKFTSAPALVREPRLHLLQQSNDLREPVSSWIASIALGHRQHLPRTLQDSFRLLGLFHILVISGLHITIIAVGGKKIIDLALRLLYIVRLLTPTTWLVLGKVVSLLSCLLILFYGCLVGFSPPAQRAVLLFIVHQWYTWREKELDLAQKLPRVFFLQMLLFPLGFLSDSLLLSWGAYLIVLHCFQEVKRASGIGGKLTALLRGQLIITALILCFFQELSLLSIPLNILLLPLIPYILLSGLLLLLLPSQLLLAVWIEQSHLFFLQQIARLAEISSNYSWLAINIGNSPPLRIALFVVLIIIVLSRAAFVSKRKEE